MKNLLSICLFVLAISCIAHEEPAKTLYERNKKQKLKTQYAESGIRAVTLWKFTEEEPEGQKVMTTHYAKDGTLLYVETFRHDTLMLTVHYSYNRRGDMISDIDYAADGTLKEKNVFEYDKKGRVVSGVSYEGSNITARFIWKHAKDKKNIEFVKYDAAGNLQYTLLYSYKDNFDKEDFISAVKRDANGVVVIMVDKQFDNSGKVLRKLVYENNGDLSYFFDYQYDEYGNNTQILKFDRNSQIVKIDTFKFDESGFCIEHVSTDGDIKVLFKIQYEYMHFID